MKTRLAATVGAEAAAAIYRRLAERVCQLVPPGVELIAVFDPPGRRVEIEGWLRGFCGERALRFIPQSEGDLGVRLLAAFAAAFAAGFEQVAVIGSDCVELTPSIFAEAWQALVDGADVVLGPSADGGYYLLALRRECGRLFEEVAWSTFAVFTQTLERAEEQGLRVRVLPMRRDVDTEDDWLHAEARFLA